FFRAFPRSKQFDCPLFVRVAPTTGPNQHQAGLRKKPDSIGANWEELTLLPTRIGLENHCTRKGTGGSNPSPSASFMRSADDSRGAYGRVRTGMIRLPLTTGGKSLSSSYTSVMKRSLLCCVSPSVVLS